MPSTPAISLRMSQNWFSRRTVVTTPQMRRERERDSYRIGSALTYSSHMAMTSGLQGDFGAQQAEETRQPAWVRRPRGCSHQIALNVAVGHRDIDERTARQSHFRPARRVSAALTTFQDTGSGQQLRPVAHRGDRLAGLVERLDQLQ